MQEKKKIEGVHVSFIFVPIIIIITIIHILIIICTIIINVNSSMISDKTKKSSDCLNTLSSIITHSSKLVDTGSTFVNKPSIEKGPVTDLNDEPLKIYIEELEDKTKDPDALLEKINAFKLDQASLNLIVEAINDLKYLINSQAHAIRLINQCVIAIPSELLDKIPAYNLTDAEKAYSKDVALDQASLLLFDKDYSYAKRDVANLINKAISNLSKAFNDEQANMNNTLVAFRILLWVLISLILVVTIFFFAMLLATLVFPIVTFGKQINDNKKLDSTKALYETNFLANAYNELLDRHREFDDKLRYVAERDSLTGLPNRYSYNEFLKSPAAQGEKVVAFLFDINKLKYTNDTFGHAKGDELIKNASLCIKECFLIDNNCYRIGGDEFVSIIMDIDENEIQSYLKKFEKAQEKYNVSIAIGYAYTSDISSIGYEKLIIEADKMMYLNKNNTR